MEYPDVTSLYKFRSYNQYSLQCLIGREEWFSRPSAFNDPFDCIIRPDESKLAESIKDAKEHIIKVNDLDPENLPDDFHDINETDVQAFRMHQEKLHHMFRDIGILSMTTERSHFLMWAHYADSHRGFVVEYERKEGNILGQEAKPVIYRPDYPSFSVHDVTSDGGRFDEIWLSKSIDWSYENEWRVMDKKGDTSFHFPCRIKSIIFGMRMPEAHRRTIKNILAGSRMRLYEATQSSSTYSLEIKEIRA